MDRQNIHIDQPTEISVVFTACMVSLLRTAVHTDMTEVEALAFANAHEVISMVLYRWDEAATDAWKMGIAAVISEINREEELRGRDRPSNASDQRGNGQHHA